MRLRIHAALTAVAALVLLGPVTSAQAHGLGAEDPNRPVSEYLWLGITHLLAGWDHLLFILAICLLAGSLWRATKLMSMFVLGHSITLSLATFQEWQVSTTFVDIVIALSVVTVAAIGLRGRPSRWEWFGGGLFAFGLIHGLGLSTRLQELGVSDDSLVARVLLFNIGVEIGQAIAVLGFFAIGWTIVRAWRTPKEWVRPAFGLIIAAGLIGAAVLSFDATKTDAEQNDSEQSAELKPPAGVKQANCREVNDQPEPTGPGGTHPDKRFYGPRETYPAQDFGHVMGDGYIVVTYRADLPAAQVQQLNRLVDDGPEGMLGGAKAGQKEAVVATTFSKRLTCGKLDTAQLGDFREQWLAEVKSSQPQE